MTSIRGFHPSRRELMVGTAAAGLSSGLTGILPSSMAIAQSQPEVLRITDQLVAAARKEGRLTFRHGAQDYEVTALAENFEKQFGVSVSLDRKVGVTNTQQFTVEERNNKHIMDVAYSTDGGGVAALIREGLLLSYTIPDADKLIPPGKSIGTYAYAPKWVKTIISYNPKIIPHDRAKSLFRSWSGLLDPSLSNGKLGMGAPSPAQIPFSIYVMLLRSPEYGKEFLTKLAAQKPVFGQSLGQSKDDLASGAIGAYVGHWDDVGRSAIMAGENAAWANPDMIPNAGNIFLLISKNAPNPAAARLFTAWILSLDGAKAYESVEILSTLTSYQDKRASTQKLAQTDWYTPFSPDTKLFEFDLAEIGANYNALVAELNTIFGIK